MIFINQRNAHAFLCNLQKHLYLTTDSVVLLEQIRVLDKQRLQARLGRLPYSYIQKIDKALAVSIGLWDKCWKHKDFVFICYPVQVSSHILAPRGGNLAHREFIYIGEPLPKLDEKEHAAFFLNLQKGILRSLKQRNLLTPAQYQECLAELGKRESKNQIRNTIKQKHSLWKKISPIFTQILNCHWESERDTDNRLTTWHIMNLLCCDHGILGLQIDINIVVDILIARCVKNIVKLVQVVSQIRHTGETILPSVCPSETYMLYSFRGKTPKKQLLCSCLLLLTHREIQFSPFFLPA